MIGIQCDKPADYDEIQLWQWTIVTSDGMAASLTDIAMCSKEQPVCPPSACLDTLCSECADDWKIR